MQSSLRLLCVMIVWPVVLLSASAEDPAPKKQGIRWEKDLATAMALAKKQNRPVIAYFTFDACVWCKRLEKACFFDPNVVTLSRKLIWVKINRDRTPAIPKRLNVFAYPSLLILGEKEENVYRFQSYQEPKEFIGNVREGLKRYALYRSGKDWVIPPTRPAKIINQGTLPSLPAPSDAVPGGVTMLKGSLWVAQKDLFEVDARTGKTLRKLPLKSSVGGLCTDGKRLYGVSYGWTAGKPIYVINPTTGKIEREIVTAANKKNRSYGAKGIAWHRGSLYVLEGMRGKLHQVNPANGQITQTIQTQGTWLSGLDFDGQHFISGSREHLYQFDPKSGKLVSKTPLNYPVRNLACHQGVCWLFEQPIFGFGKKHERIQLWPKTTMIHRWKIPDSAN